jgi:D-alanine--D-alanine ligase
MLKDKKKYNNVAVLMGGESEERDISLISGETVMSALEERGYNISPCILDKVDEDSVKKKILKLKPEVIFIAMHGGAGEDGRIQTILEKLKVPYTGSGPKASYNAMNKLESKKIFIENDISTADYIVVDNISSELLLNFDNYPCVVKPVSQGSSVGLSIIKAKEELSEAIKRALKHDVQVMIASYISGKEVTVGILDNEPLAVLEIIPHRDFYDFQAKYDDELTKYVVPAEIEDEISQKTQEMAKRAHDALGCDYFSRVDLRISTAGKPYVLEVNTIPGLTSHSLLPKAALEAGYDFCDLCEKILNSAGLMK